ncbi:MAG TPA: hypothetical protein VMU53_06785 [Candidatus Sulfotelmatobacter sp.]|nr:hypothetical protein [Candidatus Sulfotelmatobacter sp.]
MEPTDQIERSTNPPASGNGETREKRVVSPSDVLAMMPRGLRYRFLDRIVEVDENHVVAQYRFREDEFFYPGHFPEQPVTPGTILLEAMCQCGMAAQAYYLLALESSIEQASAYRIFFTEAKVGWFGPVAAGTQITMHSELVAWRRGRVRARVRVFNEQEQLVAESEVAGQSVLLGAAAPATTGSERA